LVEVPATGGIKTKDVIKVPANVAKATLTFQAHWPSDGHDSATQTFTVDRPPTCKTPSPSVSVTPPAATTPVPTTPVASRSVAPPALPVTGTPTGLDLFSPPLLNLQSLDPA
jgi:hypothetical protein